MGRQPATRRAPRQPTTSDELSALRRPLSVVIAGVSMLAIGAAARLTLRQTPWVPNVATLTLLAGGATTIVGLFALLFKIATQRSFEWFIAWRYLRDRAGRRSWATLIVGGVMLLLAGAVFAASFYWGRAKLDDLLLGPSTTQRILQAVALGVAVLGYVVIFFGGLLLAFSIFTSISVFGVFLGTCALIVVLSVMGGFEFDLRNKILGTTAHVMITKPKRVFGEYREVERRLAQLPEVAAYSPYLESEVMITSQTNLSGVLLKGIDPNLISRVTDLPKYLRAVGGAGRLSNLVHPERLAKIPESRLRPLRPDDEDGSPRRGTGEGSGSESGDGDDPASRPASQPASQAAASQAAASQSAAGGASKPRPKVEVKMWDVKGEIGKKIPPRPVYPGIIIGAELAKNLRLYVGDDVNVVAPLGGMSPAGPIPKARPFRVAGIFYSGMYEYDTKFAYVTIPAAQRFLGLEDEVTGIEIKVRQIEAATPLAETIDKTLAGRGFKVEDWKQLNSNLFSALKLEKVVMFIVLTFIVLVASFSIITNLIMVVLEKGREISALKTMGTSNQSAMKVFLYAGIYIGTIGTLVGVLTGVGICMFLAGVGLPLDPEVYYISTLPVRMNPLDIAIVALAGVTLSLLATMYPSLLAARLEPVEGLRRYEI